MIIDALLESISGRARHPVEVEQLCVPNYFPRPGTTEKEMPLCAHQARGGSAMIALRNMALMVAAYIGAACVIITLIAAGGAYGVGASMSLLPDASQGTSPLKAQLETARSVREALARKVAGPEPLGPITAKRANPAPPQIAHIEIKKYRKPGAAMNAMAMELTPPAQASQYAPVDRFAPQ